MRMRLKRFVIEITISMPTAKEIHDLIEEIDSNPLHPVNDARHPQHPECQKAYLELLNLLELLYDSIN